MKIRKWLARAFAILLSVTAFWLVGCGGNQAASSSKNEDGSESSADSGLENGDETSKETHWGDDGVLKILTIGNSFSDDTMQWMYPIAQNAGVEKVSLGNLYIGACTLSKHLINARENKAEYIYHTNNNGTWTSTQNYLLADAVSSQNWDFISFQQASGSSGQPYSYDVLQDLMDIVRGLCPSAKFVWNMTWAYQADSNHSAFVNYKNDQAQMYKAITRTVQAKVLPNEEIVAIIPNATSIQNARTSYLGDTLTRDGYHLTYDVGRYIAGLTFFHALTGIDISDLSYAPDGVNEKARKMSIESAINAVKNPYEVTPSQYTE